MCPRLLGLPVVNEGEAQSPDTSAAIVGDVDSGRDRDRNYIPIDEIWSEAQNKSFPDSNK